MRNISFSLADYQTGLSTGQYRIPDIISSYTEVDRVRYRELEQAHQKKDNGLEKAFRELSQRVGADRFRKLYPLQAKTLNYASLAFPSYRFILPEVITEDWLAAVDWHKFHRDHVLHQPLTGYIVLKMLIGKNGCRPMRLSNGRTLLDTCVDQIVQFEGTSYIKDALVECGLNTKSPWISGDKGNLVLQRLLWRLFFVETAFMAAVFHDLGYPWQYLGLLDNKLDHATVPAMKNGAAAGSVKSGFCGRLIYTAMNGYRTLGSDAPVTWDHELLGQTNDALCRTHGLPGALGFLFLNDRVRRFPALMPNPVRQLCVEWAAVAVMMHDMAKVYWGTGTKDGIPIRPHLRLRSDVDPLSSLITLADNLQDFERPVGSFSNNNGSTVRLRYGPSCTRSSLHVDSNGHSTLLFKMRTPQDVASKLKRLPDEQLEIFDSRYGYLDLSGWGMTSVEMKAGL